MAIANDIYTRCRVCTEKAATILTDMTKGNYPEPLSIKTRRTAADVAGDATYALLCHTFITPIDREDLWLLRDAAERVWRTAEDTALLSYYCGQLIPCTCESVIHAAAACCTVAKQVVEIFPRTDTIVQQMRILRESQYTCHITMCNCFADTTVQCICESAYRVIMACEKLIDTLRYTAIKNG